MASVEPPDVTAYLLSVAEKMLTDTGFKVIKKLSLAPRVMETDNRDYRVVRQRLLPEKDGDIVEIVVTTDPGEKGVKTNGL